MFIPKSYLAKKNRKGSKASSLMVVTPANESSTVYAIPLQLAAELELWFIDYLPLL